MDNRYIICLMWKGKWYTNILGPKLEESSCNTTLIHNIRARGTWELETVL